MRVLHVIPSLAGRDGGPGKAIVEMCRELRRHGHKPLIYTTNADGAEHLPVPLERLTDVRGVEIIYFPVNGGHYYKLSQSLRFELKKNVEYFDAVHVHALYQFPSTAAAYYCRKHRVPYILQPHGSLDPYLYRRHPLRKRLYELAIERRNLAGAAAVLFTSAEEMKLAQSLGLRFHGAVVPLGVEVEEATDTCPDAADEMWPELAGQEVILFLGRIHPVKALDVLAKAFGEIHRARADTRLVIAGPDTNDYATQVRGWLVAQDALQAAVFTGMVTGDRKAALLKRADMVVLPSYTENFGIAAVEAMAAGVPVVVSKRVKIWRDIEFAGAGLVVNPDAKELAGAALALLKDPLMARGMGARGKSLARERFSWSAVGDQLIRLYEETASGRFPEARPAATTHLTSGQRV